jgi:hypothetical protein
MIPAFRCAAVAALICVLVGGAGSFGAAPASAQAPGIALLVNVEAHDMGDFDRVTFTFRASTCIDVPCTPAINALPTIIEAAYVTRPIASNPSGEEVEVAGASIIRITMSNAAGFDLSVDPPVQTYTGPRRIQPNLPNVIDIVETGDFEAVLSWAIGIRSGQVPAQAQVIPPTFTPTFRPTQVIVDIPHAAAIPTQPSFTG